MLFRTFFAARRPAVLALLALGMAVGILEGAFVLLVRKGLTEPPVSSRAAPLIAAAFAAVTLRSLFQWIAARVEAGSVFAWVGARRAALLALAGDRRFPAYREPWRGPLARMLERGLPDIAEGASAGLRCFSAGAQAAVLLPLLPLFSWKPALAAFLLALPVLWISRLRSSAMAKASARFGISVEARARDVENFADALESDAGNGDLAGRASAHSAAQASHEGAARDWELSKALFPPILEWLFFAALAALLALAAAAGEGSGSGRAASLLPFAALLLLLYRPIREWARAFPARLPGDRAWEAYRNLYDTLEALPRRTPPPAAPGRQIVAEGLRFGYDAAPAGLPEEDGEDVSGTPGTAAAVVQRPPGLPGGEWLEEGRPPAPRRYRPIFRCLDAVIDPAELTWIPGPNGAGKSTFLKLLAGVESPAAGRLLLPARLLAAPFPFSYLPQRAVIAPDWPEWAAEHRRAHPDDWEALDGILGLSPLLAKSAPPARGRGGNTKGDPQGHSRPWAAALSGGERQRLALARAFASPAPCLLLDEPTTWLSAADRERVMGDLLAFWRRRPGRGGVIVSHEAFLGEFCSRTLRLDRAEKPAIPRRARMKRPDPR
jgi:ABC-type multidrug transport system fused ATPase/permease subunit